MATVIDRLIFELGLDAKDFDKGRKQAAAALLRSAKEAEKAAKDIERAMDRAEREAEKRAREIEKSIDKAGESIDRLARNVLKLYAIFTAGREIKSFVSDITAADAALGRLSRRVGTAPGEISALSNAVARAGGNAEAAGQSFQSFRDNIEQLRATGESSIVPFLNRLQAAGGKQINLNRDISQTFGDIAENLKAVADKQGAATASWYGRQLGLDADTVALLIKGRKAYQDAVAESKRLGAATQQDTDAAERLQGAWRGLMQASEGLGRTLVTQLSPYITDLLKQITEWIAKNREWIKTEITENVKQFVDVIKSVPWAAIGKGLAVFVSGANEAAKAVGGWLTVTTALFALLTGASFAAVLRSLWLLRTLLMGGSIAGAAGGAATGAAGAAAGAARVAAGGVLGGIMGVLGLGAVAAAANSQGALRMPERTQSWGEWFARGLDPRLGDHFYGPQANGGAGSGGPTITGRITGRIRRALGLGGGEGGRGGAGGSAGAAGAAGAAGRPGATGSDGGRLNARAPERAGQYRPQYRLSDADLDQRVVNTIAGEVSTRNAEGVDAVINNMLNRVGSRGWGPSRNLLEVARAPGQYAGYRRANEAETEFVRSRIRAIASGGVPDNTRGSNAYRAAWYNGPWARRHRDVGVVIGGNRFAYERGFPNGPYAPYSRDTAPAPGRAPAPNDAGTGRLPAPGGTTADWRSPMPSAGQYAANVRALHAMSVVNTNDNRSTNSTVSNATNISAINIHTQATDASGIARSIDPAMKTHAFANAAQYGMA